MNLRNDNETEYLDAWRASPAQPREQGAVRLVVARTGGGAHEVLAEATLTAEFGVPGDRWNAEKDPERESQVTLMCARVVEIIAKERRVVPDAGDNLLVDFDLSEEALPTGARLRVGDALLEVTAKPHTGCKKFHARFGGAALRFLNHESQRANRLRGVHARVIEDGRVRPGDTIERVPA